MENKTKLAGKIKKGTILYDDAKLLYEVVEVFTQSCVVEQVFDKTQNYSCEIMTFRAMEDEGWIIVK